MTFICILVPSPSTARESSVAQGGDEQPWLEPAFVLPMALLQCASAQAGTFSQDEDDREVEDYQPMPIPTLL